jgi:hypothetical protein
MTWPKYVLLALYAASAILTVAWIGKPRKPTTPGVAALTLVFSAMLAWLVVIA